MSGEKPKPVTERVSTQPGPILPPPSLEGPKKTEGNELKVSKPPPFTSPSRLAVEHSYAKLLPFRSSHGTGTGSKDSSFSTVVLFGNKVNSKLAKKKAKGNKRRPKHSKVKLGSIGGGVEEVHSSHGEMSNEEGECSVVPTSLDAEPSSDIEAEDIIDVTSVDPVVTLPYDEKKVSSIMVECARHVNVVKVPTDTVESEALIGRLLSECDYKQQTLLKQLIGILEGDKLARLACVSGVHEPIKRRLNTDKAARRFRKVLANVKWDPKLTRWCHETLLRVLDTNLLPIYLDVLQVLKSKCPVLVEQMIHSSMSMAGGEAFALLLKRPWNPAVGLYTTEKQVKFDAQPLFVSLPYATTGLGGRRWRMFHSQLSPIGKVFPIMLPDSLTDVALNYSLKEFSEQMLLCSLQRVQELCGQYPSRPIILIGFSLASRIAAKIAELLPVSLIISLGLPSAGAKWKLSSDPFKDCRTPTLFAVGSDGRLTSVTYVEKLRGKMKTPTSLVVVGGGDDLLRLSLEDKQLEDITQSIVDRCILEEMYKFMVHILPCSFNFPEDQHRLLPRKRKIAHSEEIGSTFLTPITTSNQSPIVLTPSPEDAFDGRNYNFNNSSPVFWRALLRQSGRMSPGDSLSSSPSPIALLERRFSGEGMPPPKRIAAEMLPKTRQRSKSTATDKPPKKKAPPRSRSKSSDQPNKNVTPGNKAMSSTSNTFTPITFNHDALSGNVNNNSNNVSPPGGGVLAIPVPQFRPLPITPPRNPYEDKPIMDRKLDPKTLRHLQLK